MSNAEHVLDIPLQNDENFEASGISSKTVKKRMAVDNAHSIFGKSGETTMSFPGSNDFELKYSLKRSLEDIIPLPKKKKVR